MALPSLKEAPPSVGSSQNLPIYEINYFWWHLDWLKNSLVIVGMWKILTRFSGYDIKYDYFYMNMCLFVMGKRRGKVRVSSFISMNHHHSHLITFLTLHIVEAFS